MSHVLPHIGSGIVRSVILCSPAIRAGVWSVARSVRVSLSCQDTLAQSTLHYVTTDSHCETPTFTYNINITISYRELQQSVFFAEKSQYKMAGDPPQPRLCQIAKVDNFDGFGFNLHAEKNKPGQFVGKIDVGSPAEVAGLKEGDRNGECHLIILQSLI